MALPDLTPEQRAQALEKATQARRRRAEVKNALKARSMNLSMDEYKIAQSRRVRGLGPVQRKALVERFG